MCDKNCTVYSESEELFLNILTIFQIRLLVPYEVNIVGTDSKSVLIFLPVQGNGHYISQLHLRLAMTMETLYQATGNYQVGADALISH